MEVSIKNGVPQELVYFMENPKRSDGSNNRVPLSYRKPHPQVIFRSLPLAQMAHLVRWQNTNFKMVIFHSKLLVEQIFNPIESH